MNSEEPPLENRESRRSPPPERKIIGWALALFAANLVCVLMLAARHATPENLHGFFDVIIFACILAAASFAMIRLIFYHPYRLLDLMVMVLVLSGGMKAAIESVRAIHAYYLNSESLRPESRPEPVMYAEACLLVGCVLMSGASLGLRHCRLLQINSPLRRAIVLSAGMLVFPAPLALFGIPLYLLDGFLNGKSGSLNANLWIVLLAAAFIATLINASLILKTIVLKTQNVAQESSWRGKEK
ncbi:MAG TPA: hypothetical protein VKX17_02960 [Planctomycetota bacterium]|nr:hypothetical protein [Planctomycetota bacterium]